MATDDQAANDYPELSCTITFDIDTAAESLLNSTPVPSTVEEESIPREIIAEEIRSTRVQAELLRPIHLGTINQQPALLLCFRFGFQRHSDGWFTRIQAADIKISFLDVPKDPGSPAGLNPSIVKFHPKHYTGAVSTGTMNRHVEVNGQVASIPSGPTIGATFAQDVSRPQEGKLVVHGLTSLTPGQPARNKIIWSVEEDRILKTGMPREMVLPLIVNMREERRFSAKVVVTAHYAFKRGLYSKLVPVIGRNVNPLYFDPAILQELAREHRTGLDGRPIAGIMGSLDDVPLKVYSSFSDDSSSV